MNEVTMTESATVNPAFMSKGRPETDKPPTGETPISGVPMNGAPMSKPPRPRALVVQLTEEEQQEQCRLLDEFGEAIVQRDRKREQEILPKIIWHAFILKNIKRLMGANHIRKEGYNTVDADLAYGPGWLDEDDGGPTCEYSEDYEPPGRYELPRSLKKSWKC